MHISRRSFLAGATGLLSALSSLDLLTMQTAGAGTSASPPAVVTLPPLTLRGYGTLSGTFRSLHAGQSSLTHVACESPQKAHLVQAKYLSDLGLLPGTEESSVSVAGHALPVRRTSTGGMVACYARGTDVLLIAAASEAQLKEVCATTLPAGFSVTDFAARIQVPMWLDRWDKYGLLAYYDPNQTPPNAPDGGADYDRNIDLRFAKDNGLGLVFWTGALTIDNAEGLTTDQTWSYLQDKAKQMGLPVHINTSNNWPVVWLGNRFREETQLKAPQFLGGFYGVAHDTSTVGALSWNSQAGEDAMLGVEQEIVRRFADDPNIVGWLEPHGETADSPQGRFLEYGPLADKAMQAFLQERYGTLAAVSQRWYGEGSRLKSWSDVRVPEVAEFAGFGPDAIDLRGTWRVKYVPAPDGHTYTLNEQGRIPSPPPTAPVPAEWLHPDFDDSGWDAFVAPGNDRMLTIPRTPLIYRRSIDIAAEWLASNPQVTQYVWDMSSHDKDEVAVSVNGQKIAGVARGNDTTHYAFFDVTKALRAGSNHLALQIPRGIICYRTYLTGVTPAQYPDLGPQKNAQWADYIHWSMAIRKAQVARGVEMIRQVDPNRSINLMAVDYVAPFKQVAQEYGCRFHDTGAMGGFWTEEPVMHMAGLRFPTSAEPGAPAHTAADLQADFGRWVTEGANAIHYFLTMGDIQWNPEVLKTFEANRRMYEMIGKYHAPFAEVGILYSTASKILTEFPWDYGWKGRSGYYSDFNEANSLREYCPRAGVSEEDFGTALVGNFRVIVDSNTKVMSEKLVAGIESYVRNGGVFVTNGQTGRHDEVHADTWPISRLTGYQVLNPRGTDMAVSVVPGQKVFVGPRWANGTGSAGESLKKAAADCQDLLLWSDGTVAAGMRPLGKGWVVSVGLTYNTPAVFQDIAKYFGVNNQVPATCSMNYPLHFRHFIGNTGLHDIWALFNESSDPIKTTLTFLPGVHPAFLTDILTNEAVEMTRAESGDSVPNISLQPWQMIMYVSPRADAARAPLEWLELQRGWWAGTKTPPAKHLPTAKEQQRFTLDLTDGWAYKRIDDATDDQAAALAQPTTDDHAWERRTLELWLEPAAPKPQRIMLRRTFTVPAHWTAGTILECNQIQFGPFIREARTFVDGKLIPGGNWNSDGLSDEAFGGILKPGSTHHVAFDVRSPSTLIGVRGPYWLTYTPDPLERRDLAGEWQGYANEMHATDTVQLPGVAKSLRFVSRSVMIDKAHKGKNVVVYARTPNGETIRGLLINGRRLDPWQPGYARHDLILNVTPLVRFGEENTIEFMLNSSPGGTNIEAAEVRYYAKGFYP